MKDSVLFVNACPRAESRTRVLAEKVLSTLSLPVEEVRLTEIRFPVVDEAFLRMRDRLLSEKNYTHPLFDYARRFAQAKAIVIAAPYWDLSFPAALKQYLEQINVVGITFRYTESGFPVSLCQAKVLYYVTTAGGNYVPDAYGFGYVRDLAQSFYGIPDIRCVKAVGLDLVGADVQAIMKSAEETIAPWNGGDGSSVPAPGD